MESQGVVRDLTLDDLDSIKRIHAASGIDYSFPSLVHPLFLVTKVFEVEGVVRAAGGAYLQAEVYLWLDQSDWATPEAKLAAIHALDESVIHELWLRGIDCAVLWLPPGMERFGERLKDMGFEKDRDGWVTFSKRTK